VTSWREAADADLAGVARLLRASMPDAWTEGMVHAALQVRGTYVLVGEATPPADPAAAAVCRVVEDELQVLVLAVAPSRRRHGLARALLASTLERGVAAGARRAFLEVRVGNVAARALYERAGFEVVSRRARYYGNGEDALVYALDLSLPPPPAAS
jgi:ribosomal-protein-alanine N-acetyltransferase